VNPGAKGVGSYSANKDNIGLPEEITENSVEQNLAHELGHAYQDDMGQPIDQTANIIDNEKGT